MMVILCWTSTNLVVPNSGAIVWHQFHMISTPLSPLTVQCTVAGTKYCPMWLCWTSINLVVPSSGAIVWHQFPMGSTPYFLVNVHCTFTGQTDCPMGISILMMCDMCVMRKTKSKNARNGPSVYPSPFQLLSVILDDNFEI